MRIPYYRVSGDRSRLRSGDIGESARRGKRKAAKGPKCRESGKTRGFRPEKTGGAGPGGRRAPHVRLAVEADAVMVAEFTDPMAMMMVVAARTDADADGGAGRGGAQQGEGKNGRDKRFPGTLLWREKFPTQ